MEHQNKNKGQIILNPRGYLSLRVAPSTFLPDTLPPLSNTCIVNTIPL